MLRTRESLTNYAAEYGIEPDSSGDPFIAIGRMSDADEDILSRVERASRLPSHFDEACVGIAIRPESTVVLVYNFSHLAQICLDDLGEGGLASIDPDLDWHVFEDQICQEFERDAADAAVLLSDWQVGMLIEDGALDSTDEEP